MRTVSSLLLGCLLFLALSSCSAVTPHENFVSIMRSQIGKSADDPNSYTGAYHRYRILEKRLENGNIEEEYKRGQRCRHFFEIDTKSRIIVGWRYEGAEKDCGKGTHRQWRQWAFESWGKHYDRLQPQLDPGQLR